MRTLLLGGLCLVASVLVSCGQPPSGGKPGGPFLSCSPRVDPKVVYRDSVNKVLLDREELESRIKRRVKESIEDRDEFGNRVSDQQSYQYVNTLASEQHRLLSRVSQLDVPGEYAAFHRQLTTALDYGNQRIDLWLAAMDQQMHSSKSRAQPIWQRQVRAADGYFVTLDIVHREKPW